jgi:tetratricopeptide (TPR) repeat protein
MFCPSYYLERFKFRLTLAVRQCVFAGCSSPVVVAQSSSPAPSYRDIVCLSGWNVSNIRAICQGTRIPVPSLHAVSGHPAYLASALLVFSFVAFSPIPVRAQGASETGVSTQTRFQRAYNTGVRLVRQGNLDEAIQTFDRGLAADPRNVGLIDAIGAAYSLKGEFVTAEGFFTRGLQIDPGFVPAQKNLAITHFNLGQDDLAASEFRRLADQSKKSRPVADLFLGMIAAKRGEYARAVVFSERAGSLLYQYPDAIISFADSLHELHQSKRAALIVSRLDELRGVSASEYAKAGVLYSELGQDKRALADFDKAERMGGSPDTLEFQRAAVLDRLGRTQEALSILKVRVAARPDAESLNLLAHVAEENHEFELALQSLKMAAKLEPEKEENYLDFSTFCADYENYPLALEAADVGLEHIPNSYRLMVQKGAVLEKLARLDEAEEVLREAVALETDNGIALLSLAIVQSHAEKLQESAATLSGAITKFPTNYYMHYYLGTVLVQIEQHDGAESAIQARAEQAFKDAIRLNSSFADSYYQLSKLYVYKAPKLAEKNLVACLRLDPDHAPAQYTLGRFYLKTGRRAEGQALIDRFERQQQAAKLKEQNRPRIAAAQR